MTTPVGDRSEALSPVERLVLPLDVPSLDEARKWIDLLAGEVGVFKVGLQLFTAEGPDAVRAVHDAGAACFLDLKLHDIPATMAKATESAVALGVRYLTVHTSAGPAALRAVSDISRGTSTEVLGVTVLTSMDDGELDAVGLAGPAESAVVRLAKMATKSGVPGLVCSPLECAALREHVGPDVTLMVPGVRPVGSDKGDQRRAATPADAISAGADLLVVGRPIRNHADPVAAARAVVSEIAGALP